MLLALILASALLSAACSGTEQARADWAAADPKAKHARETKERTQTAKATAGGNAAARTDDAEARAGRAVVVGKIAEDARGSVEGMDGPQQATLRITGDPGTRFSGACLVGEKERVLDGRVPERYAFEPGGKKLECEVRKEGGALKIVFTDGASVRSEQRTGAGESTVRFAYSGSSIASSTSSVSVQRAVMSSDGYSSDGPR